jgi:hypothetical protein
LNVTEVFGLSLLYLAVLHIIGRPFLWLLGRGNKLEEILNKLDVIQRLPIEFVFGGSIVYVCALVLTPWHLFDESVWVITVIGVVAYVVMILRSNFRQQYSASKISLVALTLFLIGLWLRVRGFANQVLGSVQDSSLHTLFVYSIIHQGGIPTSVIPGSVLQVPQGLHVVLAYFSLLSNIPPELVVLYEFAFFNATIILAAYLFASILLSKEYAIVVAALVCGIGIYPIAITWGAHWIPWALTIFFVATSLIFFSFTHTPSSSSKALVFLTALLLGYLLSTYPPLFVIIVLISGLYIIYDHKRIRTKLGFITASFLGSLPVAAIWIYRYLSVNNYTTPFLAAENEQVLHNTALYAAQLYLPFNQLLSPQMSRAIWNWIGWPVMEGWPGGVLFTVLLTIGIVMVVIAPIIRGYFSFNRTILGYLVCAVITTLLWGLNSPDGLFCYTSSVFGIMMQELDKVYVIMATILLPFLAAFPLYEILHRVGRGRNLHTIMKQFHSLERPHVLPVRFLHLVILVSLLAINLAVIPSGVVWLKGNYNVFAIATDDDYQLLKWMKNGIPDNANVLVSPFDAGQYVPAISDKPTVGIASTGVIYLSPTYYQIHRLIQSQTINTNFINDFKALNISYAFIGSHEFNPGWDQQFFYKNPLYFQLVKNFGLACLFKVLIPTNAYANPGIVNDDSHIGISDGKTLLDFKNMAVYNIQSGQGEYIEIGARDSEKNIIEQMNNWNRPTGVDVKLVQSLPNPMVSVQLYGSKINLSLAVSVVSNTGLNVTVSGKGLPYNSTVFFDYCFVDYLFSNDQSFPTSSNWSTFSSGNISAAVSSLGFTTFFSTLPYSSYIYSSKPYLVTWNYAYQSLNFMMESHDDISDGTTLIDFNGMAVLNTQSGQGEYFEIGLKSRYNGQITERLNAWNRPIVVETTMISGMPNPMMSAQLYGSKMNFSVTVSVMPSGGLNVSLSDDGLPKDSILFFDYLPVDSIVVNNATFPTSNNWSSYSSGNVTIDAVVPSPGLMSFFSLLPCDAHVYTIKSYLVAWSYTPSPLNFMLSSHVGISDGKTLLDPSNMVIYNMQTGEREFVELGVRNSITGIEQEHLNSWNKPTQVDLSMVGATSPVIYAQIYGPQYIKFDLTISVLSKGLNVTISTDRFSGDSIVFFDYFPIDSVTVGNQTFSTATAWSAYSMGNINAKGRSPGLRSNFSICPYESNIYTTQSYLVTWNTSPYPVNFLLDTG